MDNFIKKMTTKIKQVSHALEKEGFIYLPKV